WPSGSALATAAAASLPPAPGRGSTTTGWPHACCKCSAMMREKTSGLGPTTSLIGRLGKSCARTDKGQTTSTTVIVVIARIKLGRRARAENAAMVFFPQRAIFLLRATPSRGYLCQRMFNERQGQRSYGASTQTDPAGGHRQRCARPLARAVRQRGAQRQPRGDRPRHLHDRHLGLPALAGAHFQRPRRRQPAVSFRAPRGGWATAHRAISGEASWARPRA